MRYVRITSIDDPLFPLMHGLMSRVFPPEEVLAYDLWAEPLQDPDIYVYVALDGEEVVGATEYRYYADLNSAMTDFTIIGKAGLGIGKFLWDRRLAHLRELAQQAGNKLAGGFAEIYDPYKAGHHDFGQIGPMNPFVRREVLSHLGYRKLDFDYVHPSWDLQGGAVEGLDLCYWSEDDSVEYLPSSLVVSFLKKYYSVMPVKPQQWLTMVEELERRENIPLLPL
ncbi:GNAT family N-acetyltransferase [Paenibacillus thermoaerophilus]|uniref:GNAT family N-acetyltransferase n=1 Tax=Paenibacillus thermoaerophilus TaxID=1215385 RepID=A0ABW2V3M6_9BACL|nr:GNAT family N-acetyltransferase [Paenibacillus thermoaerophilus]TMV17174.1 GNAT family N-acetyltransferase [Paenibacillus thermoaerophilus]